MGITPSLVSAAALVNPLHPNQRISNVPGITDNNDGTDTFGATAARFWLMAYQQTLQSQQWTWPTADSAPGEQVPSVTNKDVNDATTQLTEAGYKVKVLSTPCGSSVQEGNVAFYGPHVAEQGATITLCESSGVAPVGAGGFQSGGGFGGGNGNGGTGGGGNGTATAAGVTAAVAVGMAVAAAGTAAATAAAHRYRPRPSASRIRSRLRPSLH